MKIKLTGEYKSLSDFESEELPDFTVITGKNGSGKTHLLEILKSANDRNDKRISITPKQERMIQFEGLEVNGFPRLERSFWNNKIRDFIDNWNSLRLEVKAFYDAFYRVDKKINSVLPNDRLDEFLKGLYENPNKHGFDSNEDSGIRHKTLDVSFLHFQELLEVYKSLRHQLFTYTVPFYLYREVAHYHKKGLLDVTESDLFKTPIHQHFFDSGNLFNSNFSEICFIFSMNYFLNEQRFYGKGTNREDNNSIPPEDFLSLGKRPWDIFNNLLNSAGLDYQIVYPTLEEFTPEISVGPELERISSNTTLSVSHLSSGEEIVFSLISRLFLSSYFNGKLIYPSLLLLDEPDAYLHPEMIKVYTDLLRDVFVKELGIKIIFTTHSPTTVALSPDESIFELNNIGECSLKWIGKDQALEVLTGAIPTLSIDYKNHKQVFVESETDGYYYRKIDHVLRQKKHELKSPLYFIDNPMGKGSSDLVTSITSKFREAGNSAIYGIIDWDIKNKSTESVLVHGEDSRYTIENFLLDPIYLGILFLKKGGAHNIYDITKLNETDNEYDLLEKDISELQRISLEILQPIAEKINIPNEKEHQKVEYYDGKVIELPLWFLRMNHEKLIEKFSSCYEIIANYQKDGKGKLQKELTHIICKSYPTIPKCTVDLLEKISNN